MAPPPLHRRSLPLSTSDRITRVRPVGIMKKKKKAASKSKVKIPTVASFRNEGDPVAFPGLKYYRGKKDLFDIIKAESNRNLRDVVGYQEQIVKSLKDLCQVLIVVVDWWSGRVVGIPCFLGNAFSGQIAITCPGSEYAKSAATSAYHFGLRSSLGTAAEDIGYEPERSSSEHRRTAKIMYMSVDALLEKMARNADLLPYDVVLVDDAHVRTLSNDVLLGMLLFLARRRHDLRLVLTVPLSARHEAAKLSDFFGPYCVTCTLEISREKCPKPVVSYVKFEYRDPTEAALAVHRDQPPGRMLMFLGGDSGTVDRACQVLHQRIASSSDPEERKVVILPMYHGHYTEFLARASEAYADPVVREKMRFQRWILVLSHDVPDSAVQATGPMYVIDTGLGKGGTRISKQAADERASHLIPLAKAGRNPKCFRLYEESIYHELMIPTTQPEILTCSSEALSVAVRKMMMLGITDPRKFEYIDQPPPVVLAEAINIAELPDLSRLTLA